MRKLKFLGLSLFFAVAFTGCGSNPDVYIAGFDAGDAVLWKNGKVQKIVNNRNYMANAVFVSDNDVWVSGKSVLPIQDGIRPAKLWKNGEEQSFPFTTANKNIISVYISNNDIYLAGNEKSILGPNVARLWKNGEAQKLINRWGTGVEVEYYNAFAHAVYVSGEDVYVAGNRKDDGEEGRIVVVLWKNGVGTDITDATNDAFVTSICVSGKDVYIAGHEKSVAKIWKNGKEQKLSNGINSSANAIYVSGNDVYVAGYEQNIGEGIVAILWKNGEAQKLTDGKFAAEANSVYVSGNDIYVAGYEGTKNGEFFAVLWKNGKAKRLTKAQAQASAYSVFVK